WRKPCVVRSVVRSVVPVGLMLVARWPGVETPGYFRIVPMGRTKVGALRRPGENHRTGRGKPPLPKPVWDGRRGGAEKSQRDFIIQSGADAQRLRRVMTRKIFFTPTGLHPTAADDATRSGLKNLWGANP